jgi:putative ABC transport system permease protein
MTFLALIVKNLFRQPVRSGLTVLGISIGITTVVALGVIAAGLRATSGEMLKAGGADFMVAQKGASDLTFSIVSEQDRAAVERVPGVERANGMLLHVSRVGSNPFFLLFGVTADELAKHPPALREGRLIAPGAADEVVLGNGAANDLNIGVGDELTIERRTLRVVGIYQSPNAWEDGGGYGPLGTVQEIAGKPGFVTAIFVTAAAGADLQAVARAIEERLPNLAAITSADEYGEVDQGMEMIDAAYVAISVLAVGIGAIGVMNTMVMSVFERTRQIGILRAVGWGSARILRMVVGESLALCAIAVLLGCGLGIAAASAVVRLPAIGHLLEPAYTPTVFIQALVVGVAVALAGAAYPAFRAVRLSPMEALRYE